MKTMETKISMMESKVSLMQNNQAPNGGSTYVRWGKQTCPGNGTSTMYSGYAAGSYYTHSGGAANYLCLPGDPQWAYYEDSVGSGGKVYGGEYELGDSHGNGGSHYLGSNVRDEDAPCAVCQSPRSSVLMIPSRLNCYPGWTKEYSGYLMSGHYQHASATEFVCVDSHVDVVPGGHPDQEGRLFYLVEGICGSLKCPPYVNGRELTCVVCSK
ncbi:short-chain collagen C4-like [Ruditapes philippinarum]|uniref:short-chain collagen C4-like n=1 Tax=Ruditapes philippinarum TaxID=129788 RepID=UPI00295B4CD2|nr:short-chain collagen C4-like [Ruditapes philippinarum]